MKTPGGKGVSTYDALLQDIANSPKSAYMGGGKSKCFIGRQKYKSDQQKTKQKAAREKRSARMLDRISALLHSPDFQLLTKRQRKELTELCAQTMSSLRWKSKSPKGSEVSQLIPKVLSVEFVIPKELKTDKTVSVSGSDSDSDSDATRPKFNAIDATLFAEMAKQVSISPVDSNISVLATT